MTTGQTFIEWVISLLKPVQGICLKCGAKTGEILCDRSLLGERGACHFVRPCEVCGRAPKCLSIDWSNLPDDKKCLCGTVRADSTSAADSRAAITKE